MSEDLKHMVESLLFVAEEPLTVDKIRKVLTDTEPGSIRDVLNTLFDEYRERAGGFYLAAVAGGYQFRTRPEYNTVIRRMLKPNAPRLSKAALETLAIVAYKQPVIRSDVEHIRGVDAGGVLRLLLERKLIRILGRKEIPGRPLIYATTKLFLEIFDLKDLKDLPSPKEIEDMSESLAESDLAALTDEPPESAPGDSTSEDLPDTGGAAPGGSVPEVPPETGESAPGDSTPEDLPDTGGAAPGGSVPEVPPETDTPPPDAGVAFQGKSDTMPGAGDSGPAAETDAQDPGPDTETTAEIHGPEPHESPGKPADDMGKKA